MNATLIQDSRGSVAMGLALLFVNKAVTYEEYDTLVEMIWSKDIENLTVAEGIINFKLKQHATNS